MELEALLGWNDGGQEEEIRVEVSVMTEIRDDVLI